MDSNPNEVEKSEQEWKLKVYLFLAFDKKFVEQNVSESVNVLLPAYRNRKKENTTTVQLIDFC